MLFLFLKLSNQSDPRLFQRKVANYPAMDVVGPKPKPEWITAYEQEKAAGRIPNIPPAIKLGPGSIKYPSGVNPLDPNVCSWTMGCKSPHDINDAPDGMMGISFDDGPQGGAVELLRFLKSVNQTATHFMIGSRILGNPKDFQAALTQGDHIAVHTWSHPLMSTLSDQAVLGEIGWTLQIIFDLSGGRLPAYWRPPYGDADNRVRAIAKKVFGLQTVIWNHDTNDWCVTSQDTNTCGNAGPANQAAVTSEIKGFAASSKSPGLIILEHEITVHSVRAFSDSWSTIKAAGWDTRPIPSLFNHPWYQNAIGAFDNPIKLNSVLNATSYINDQLTRPTKDLTSDVIASTSNSSLSQNSTNSPQSRAQSGMSRKEFKSGQFFLVFMIISLFSQI